ncbi:MAG: beta-ketoacyl synthase N-terminal-like domain-containing protein [Desulfobacterales bacterium]
MKATITGIGVVGGFGCGVSALEKAAAESTGIPAKTFKIRTTDVQADVSCFLADTTSLAAFVPRKALRRIDHFARLALLGSYLALADAGLDENRRGRMGIVVATGYGSTCDTFDFLNTTLDEDDPCSSPIRFANSVHSAAAAHIAAFLGEHGPTLTINQYDMSVPLAFQTACQWLEEDRVDSVLVGGADEFSRAMGFYTQHLQPGRKSGPPPDDAITQSPVGEGSAFFVLEKDSEEPSSYAHVSSAGVTAMNGSPDAAPPGTKMIVNPDSRRTAPQRGNTECASFAHLYGSLPVGMAFDIAMAAIMLKTGKRYPAGTAIAGDRRQKVTPLRAAQVRDHQHIGCLKFGLAGDVGLVVLSTK